MGVASPAPEMPPSRRYRQTRFRPSSRSLVTAPQGIDDLQAREVFFVFGDNHAIIRFGDCGNDHVEWAPWPTFRRPVGHQPRPDKAGLLVEREHSAGEQRLRALRAGKPKLQFPALLSGRLLQYSAPDLSDCQGRDKQIRVGLFRHPRDQPFRWRRFGDIADDIGVEEAPAHRSTLRPNVTGRLRSRSAPTRGDRRNALRIPPFFGSSPEMVRRTVARRRAESGPLRATGSTRDRRRAQEPRTGPSLAGGGASGSCAALVFAAWCSWRIPPYIQ